MPAESIIWKPNVTVAAVIERDGRFLLVEEHTDSGARFNQPAGHWEPGESLMEGAIRETLEETAHVFMPTALLGVYPFHDVLHDTTYLRFAFTGEISGHDTARALDTGIIRAAWMTVEEIRDEGTRHRTLLVMRCIDDYLAGRRYPLELITDYCAQDRK
jgi:8-oxo-dGTP pyrophosphatase MutT (NUDIX family)